MQKLMVEAKIEEAGYRGSFSIKNVSLSLEGGEVLVITGRSGSGKTTLAKALLGLLELEPNGFFKGKALIEGIDPRRSNPEDIYSKVAYIPQDPWYGIIAHIVYAEFCLSLSIVGKRCDVKNLRKYGLYRLKDHITYGLSAGETQRLLWASNLERGARLFVLDEPGVYIDVEGRGFFRKALEKEVSEGRAAIIIDHDPRFWEPLGPYLLVLDEGNVKYMGKYNKDLVESLAFPNFLIKEIRERNGKILEASNIWFKYPGEDYILKGINIELRRGEILGITGPNGSGKTTLLKVLAKVLKPKRGQIKLSGRPIYVPENPLLYFSGATPREELSAVPKGKIQEMRELLEEFDLVNLLDRPLARLSSGERRRITLVSAYLLDYDIFLLDEPSGGLDSFTLETLLKVIERIASSGKGIIIASHDPRLEGIYDRMYKIKEGKMLCSS